MTNSRFRVLALIVCVVVVPIASWGQTPSIGRNTPDQIAADYSAGFTHRVLTLRIPSTSYAQHFDGDGNLTSKSPTGPWTLYGKLMIESVKTDGRELVLEGKRVWVRFTDGQMQNLVPNPPQTAKITIELAQGPEAAKQADAAMSKVFLGKGEKMSEIAPDYWRPYLRSVEEGTPLLTLREESEKFKAKLEAASKSQAVVTEGVSRGLLIHVVRPDYPRQAQSIRMSGSVVLRAVIGTDGRIASIYIEKPVGVGLDDEAVRAVKEWRYKPYALNGVPTTVDTEITVNFQNTR